MALPPLPLKAPTQQLRFGGNPPPDAPWDWKIYLHMPCSPVDQTNYYPVAMFGLWTSWVWLKLFIYLHVVLEFIRKCMGTYSSPMEAYMGTIILRPHVFHTSQMEMSYISAVESLEQICVFQTLTIAYLEPFHDPRCGWSLGLVLGSWPSKEDIGAQGI